MHALVLAAWNLWHLGFPDRALARARESVDLARSLQHPFSLAYALQFQTAGLWLCRAAQRQQDVATEVIALSESQGFPLWLGLGRAFRAAASLASTPAAEVAKEILQGLGVAARTGQLLGSPLTMALLAEVNLESGQYHHALRSVQNGLDMGASTGQHFFDAELHRLKGETVLAEKADGAIQDSEKVGEECLRCALEIARTQGAKSFELRAATSLARLWRDQDRRAPARDLLVPLYAWFTEGFDTGDLVAARQLVDELQ
jgi:predicted ATPase